MSARALVAELAEVTAIAARLAAALAETPDDGDGCAYLPDDSATDAHRSPVSDDRQRARAKGRAENDARKGSRDEQAEV